MSWKFPHENPKSQNIRDAKKDREFKEKLETMRANERHRQALNS